MTQAEFGKQIGKSRNTLMSWEKTGGIPDDMYLVIENVFGISADWLLSGGNKMFSAVPVHSTEHLHTVDEAQPVPSLSQLPGEYGRKASDITIVDVDILTPAGVGNTSDEEGYDPVETIQFEKRFITSDNKLILKAVRARGDSMYPTIVDNGICGVDFEDKVPIDNGIFLIRFPDIGITIKRLQMKTGGMLAIGDNRQVEPELIPIDILQRGLILGRIRWIYNKV